MSTRRAPASGSLVLPRHPDIEIKQDKDDEKKDVIVFGRSSELGKTRAAHGLMRALVGNMLTGVTKGFERQLEINGVGYKAEIKGPKITLSLGYSHPIEFALPEGIVRAKTDKNLLILSGIDRQALGAAAAKIRGFPSARRALARARASSTSKRRSSAKLASYWAV